MMNEAEQTQGTWSNEATGALTAESLLNLRASAKKAVQVNHLPTLLLPPWFATDAGYQHFVFGLHEDYEGRRYRRGKGWCEHCGAPLSAGWSMDGHFVYARTMAKDEFARAGVEIPEA